ncbi:MAG: DUF4301 family protein [Bacteroidales bacterium]
MKFTAADLKLIESKGISLQEIENQIERFRMGFPFAQLVRPATISDGIIPMATDEADKLADIYDRNYTDIDRIKFVPASGAASRMFKSLFSFLTSFEEKGVRIPEDEAEGFNSVAHFIKNIHSFAFYEDLRAKLAEKGYDLGKLLDENDYPTVIKFLVTPEGLNYGNLPKGLLAFHLYDNEVRTSFEEHLVEGALYAADSDGVARIHFTVSPEHRERFETLLDKVREKYEKRFGIRYEVTFSVQKPSTDTIAVNMDNEPFRSSNGTLLFRPGGHGALIENLNDLDSDLVFVKNIDNIVPDRLKAETVRYKKALAGLLLQLRDKTFRYLEQLEKDNPDERSLKEIEQFATEKLMIALPSNFGELSAGAKAALLFERMNRPIRVCGMVKNEGEPGGGPFWVKSSDGEVSLQIVESSQIDMSNPEQKEIVSRATHFNPVDLVCGLRDFRGRRFHLPDFIDPETGFISAKSAEGRELKALERPGLWNGAMARWITLFVEVPLITFNPVKVINDLLRPQHQPE